MRILHRSLIAVAALITTSSLLHAAAPTYPITIVRPDKAGESYDIHTTVNVSMKRSVKTPDAPAHVDQIHTVGDLTARLTVLILDAKGDPGTFTLAVSKFTAGPDATEVVPAGKVIIVTRTETEVTAVLPDQEKLNPEALSVIKAIYTPVRITGVTDDDIMGSKTPRAVGESWSINPENTAKDLAKESIVDPKDISGKTTIKSVEKINGIQALHLLSRTEAKNFRPADMPPQVNMDDSHMTAQIDCYLPVDPNLIPPESRIVMDMTIHANGGAGAPKVEVILHAEKKELITNVTK